MCIRDSPFTNDEIKTVWEHQSDPWVDTVLILLYSGWRISEFLNLKPEDIDLKEGTMKGGTKTKAGKNRIVPIHPKIRPLIERRLAEGGSRLISYNGKICNQTQYRIFLGGYYEGPEAESYPARMPPHL